MNMIKISIKPANAPGHTLSIKAEGEKVELNNRQNIFTFLYSQSDNLCLRAWIWSYEESIIASGFTLKSGKNTVQIW
jgi:hypothetical protein